MSTFDFSTIDTNKPASYKQIMGVATRFSSEGFKALDGAKPDWKLQRQILGMIYTAHPKDTEEALNHGQVQEMFKMDMLPANIQACFDASKIKKEKAKKTTEKTPKITQKESPAKSTKKAVDSSSIIKDIMSLPKAEKEAFTEALKEMLK